MPGRVTCSICISFTSEKIHDYFVTTPGGHIFHNSCITSYIRRHDNPLCPECREPITLDSLTRLYGIETREHRVIDDFEIDHVFKIVVLGDSGVGKSALIRRIADDEFSLNMVSTVGCDFLPRIVEIGNLTIKVNMWDTAGDEKFRSIIPSYLRNAHAVLLCYSITDSDSYRNIQEWISAASTYAPESAVRLLIGNKADQHLNRHVLTSEAMNFATQEQFTFFETSAKDSYNMEAVLRTAVAEILEKPALVESADALRDRGKLNRDSTSCSIIKLTDAVTTSADGCFGWVHRGIDAVREFFKR